MGSNEFEEVKNCFSENPKTEYRYESWIDRAKTVCIGGVVLQHVRGYVYTNDKIFYSVWFVVALFIMIGGYNAMSSYKRHKYFALKQKLIGILVPYAFATIIYRCFELHFFDAEDILNHLIRFDACGPMYYVAVYVQLLLVTPFLISLVLMCHRGKRIMKLVISVSTVVMICYITVHYTNIFDIIIGGGDLFAGPWLLFWFAGMLIYDLGVLRICDKHRFCSAIVSTTVLVIWQILFVEKGMNLKLSAIFHGTKVGMTWANSFQAVAFLFWFKSVIRIIEIDIIKKNAEIQFVLRSAAFWGKHSLYIFLYHMLFLSVYKDYLGYDAYFNKITCLVFIITAPIILEIVLKMVNKWVATQMTVVKIHP